MNSSTTLPSSTKSEQYPVPTLVIVRRALLVVWVLVVTYTFSQRGIPFDRVQTFGWIGSGLVIANIGRDKATILKVIVDFVPLAILLAIYDVTRGLSDTLGMPVQRESIANIEQFFFNGHIPTVWLQEHLGPFEGPVRWWEIPVALVYLTHFFATFIMLGVLWFRKRAYFREFRNRFLGLTFAGLATYILVPAAPPWMASEDGMIGPVDRSTLRALRVLPFETTGDRLIYLGKLSNQVAAMPSLHAGWATLISLYLLRFTPKWSWPLLLAFPAFMGFALVVSGEHYVVDVFFGYLYAALIILLFDVIAKRRGWDLIGWTTQKIKKLWN